MISARATEQGIGIELWNTMDGMEVLYDDISGYWNEEVFWNTTGGHSRDSILSGFCYEIRHAYQGDRLRSDRHPLTGQAGTFVAAQFSWVHILFALAALRQNIAFATTSESGIRSASELAACVAQALQGYDKPGADLLRPFLEGAIFSGNEYLYQYMLSVNVSFFRLGGGRAAFRKLPVLMSMASYGTAGYKRHLALLRSEARRHNCPIEDLEPYDADIDYDGMAW